MFDMRLMTFQMLMIIKDSPILILFATRIKQASIITWKNDVALHLEAHCARLFSLSRHISMLWCTVSEPQAFIIGRASSVTFTAFREVSHFHALFLFFFFLFSRVRSLSAASLGSGGHYHLPAFAKPALSYRVTATTKVCLLAPDV